MFVCRVMNRDSRFTTHERNAYAVLMKNNTWMRDWNRSRLIPASNIFSFGWSTFGGFEQIGIEWIGFDGLIDFYALQEISDVVDIVEFAYHTIHTTLKYTWEKNKSIKFELKMHINAIQIRTVCCILASQWHKSPTK